MAFPATAVEQVRWFAQVGHTLDKGQSRRLCSLAEACKQVLQMRLLELMRAHPGCPILLQYSGDCTPTHVREYSSAAKSHKQRRLSGTKAVEFYVHQTFVTVGASDGSRVHSVLLANPLALDFGKSMAALLPIALRCPGLKLPNDGPRIVVLHQVHDRAMSSSFRHGLSGAWASTMAGTTGSMAASATSPPEDVSTSSPSSL